MSQNQQRHSRSDQDNNRFLPPFWATTIHNSFFFSYWPICAFSGNSANSLSSVSWPIARWSWLVLQPTSFLACCAPQFWSLCFINNWATLHIMVGFSGHRIPEFITTLYKISEDRFQQNLGEFRELLELGPFLNTPVKVLSLGQRMFAQPCCTIPNYLPFISQQFVFILLPRSTSGALSSTYTKTEA